MFQILEENVRILLKELIDSDSAQKVIDQKFDETQSDNEKHDGLRHSLGVKLKGHIIRGGWFEGRLRGVVLTRDGQEYFADEQKHLGIMQAEKYKWSASQLDGAQADDEPEQSFIIDDALDAQFNIERPILRINERIEIDGGDEKNELLELLSEVKEMLIDINDTRRLPHRKSFANDLRKQKKKHYWFYVAIISLIGQAGLSLIGKNN